MSCKKIIEMRHMIVDEVNKMEHVYILGNPPLSVLAFGSKSFDIYRIGDEMSKRKWAVNLLQSPPAIHLTITYRFDGELFIKDLKEVVSYILETPDIKPKGNSAIYGTAEAIPDKSIVKDAIKIFLNTIYLTKETKEEEKEPEQETQN